MMTAESERRRLLKKYWGSWGWSQMRGFEAGTKKWERHKEWLIKKGYIEADSGAPELFRITDAGRTWLGAAP